MLLLSSLLYLLISNIAFAAPVQNLTALSTEIAPGWVADPSGRGTWTLLYSCIFTIFLCVYSAIHLNVPPFESDFNFWLRKTKWVFIAILAPEVVVYTAFEQWMLSRKFRNDLNKIVDNYTDSKTKGWAKDYDPKCRFDMVYAQYAVMGGFAADIGHLHNAITQRVTVTTEGIRFLASHGCFCRIKKDHIQDKSKADILAKGLVCVQVLWMAGQAIERKIAGYPITLLEVHTLVHVVCAIIMYGLWIRKPLNVKDPTMVDFRDAPDILAFMVEHSRRSGLKARPGFRTEGKSSSLVGAEPEFVWFEDPNATPVQIPVGDPGDRPEIDSPLKLRSQGPTQEPIQISTLYSCTHKDVDGVTHYYPIGKTVVKYIPEPKAEIVCKMVSGQASSLGYGPDLEKPVSYLDGRRAPTLTDRMEMVSLSKKDILRLNSSAQFLATAGECFVENPTVSKPSYYRGAVATSISEAYGTSIGCYESAYYLSGYLLALRAPNFRGDFLDNINSQTSYLITAMAMIPAAYGCVHIGALGLIFPSSVERLLWEISSYYLLAVAVLCGVLGLVMYVNGKIDDKWNVDIINEPLQKIFFGLGRFGRGVYLVAVTTVMGLFGIVALVYLGARLFIVVESVISLRHVPIGVYQTPDVNFMNHIPHL